MTKRQKIKRLADYLAESQRPAPYSGHPDRRLPNILDFMSNSRGEFGFDVEINQLRREIHSDNLKIHCNCDGDLV